MYERSIFGSIPDMDVVPELEVRDYPYHYVPVVLERPSAGPTLVGERDGRSQHYRRLKEPCILGHKSLHLIDQFLQARLKQIIKRLRDRLGEMFDRSGETH